MALLTVVNVGMINLPRVYAHPPSVLSFDVFTRLGQVRAVFKGAPRIGSRKPVANAEDV